MDASLFSYPIFLDAAGNTDLQPAAAALNLSGEERHRLETQIDQLGTRLLVRLRELSETAVVHSELEPYTGYSKSGSQEDFVRGNDLIREGKIGCLLLTGGEGTRLHFDGPKGSFPISPVKQKSLFQLCAERVLAAGIQAERTLSLAIMTSPKNDAAVKAFFIRHDNFGLDPGQIDFFIQDQWPYLDKEGNLFLESRDQIAVGPNGNGMALWQFYRSGIWVKWKQQGIQYVNVILIDNPLADPFDAELAGFQDRLELDAAVKSIKKEDPDEKVGMIVKAGEGCRVVEYSELSEAEKHECFGSTLKHCCANLSLISFSMPFIEAIGRDKGEMPLHRAWKKVKYLAKNGKTTNSKEPAAWKFETFLFDALPFTQRTGVLLYSRAQCFAPLKNASGADSPQTVREALMQRDCDVWKKVTGLEWRGGAFELDPQFHYPTEELIEKWKGRTSEGLSGYIQAQKI